MKKNFWRKKRLEGVGLSCVIIRVNIEGLVNVGFWEISSVFVVRGKYISVWKIFWECEIHNFTNDV